MCIDHSMMKEHYISFVAAASSDDKMADKFFLARKNYGNRYGQFEICKVKV